jgi:hypothetical protein
MRSLLKKWNSKNLFIKIKFKNNLIFKILKNLKILLFLKIFIKIHLLKNFYNFKYLFINL